MTREDALRLDDEDPLAGLRDAFHLPPGLIYLDGNSLGPLPRSAAERVAETVNVEWGQDLIRSWNTRGWMSAPGRVGDKIARLVGAAPGEVTVADSTSVSLFKLAAGALALRPDRRTILSETGNFPTDLYVLQGLAELTGATLRAVPRSQLLEAIDETTACVVLTHVHYKSAARWDMAAITAAAQAKGALALWDLSHSTGAVALDLNGCQADLAVGCGYKYLNGGPGAPAFLFVARRHQAAIRSPISGWMGHAQPFAFVDDYQPAPDIRAMVSGTPPVLGLAALEAGVDLQLRADPALVEAKGLALSELFIKRMAERCPDLALASPADPAARGLHVALSHPEGYAIVQALAARGVVGDFRSPDILRFGFSPLYLGYAEVWDAVEIAADILDSRAYDTEAFRARSLVT